MAERAPKKRDPAFEAPRADDLAVFVDIGKALASTLDADEVLRSVMLKVADLVHPRQWWLALIDEARGRLRFVASAGEGTGQSLPKAEIALDQGLIGWVVKEGRALRVEHARADPRFDVAADVWAGPRTGAVLAVPIRLRERALGAILLSGGPTGAPFDDRAERLLSAVADFAAIALENARNFRRVEELTLVDEHTGLYNARHLRNSLAVEVARSSRFGRPFSLIFFDLDRFKRVNDRWGHLPGSRMLAEVAKALLHHLRSVDIATRYGGDEFAVILPETPKASALKVAERIREMLANTPLLPDMAPRLKVTASIGVATFPDDGLDAEELLRAADRAMYRVKRAKRNGIADAGVE